MRRWTSAAALSVAAAAMLATVASAQTYTFESYTAGSLVGQVDPNSGGPWEIEIGATEPGTPVVDDTVASPLGGGSKSIRWDTSSGNGRVGIDLPGMGIQPGAGLIRFQYDFRVGTGTGAGELRFVISNRAGITAAPYSAGPPATGQVFFWTDAPWQFPNIFSNTGGSVEIWGGINGVGQVKGSPFVNATVGVVPNPNFKPGRWVRMKYWINMNAVEPARGNVVYAALYDISCGSEMLIGERHPDYDTASLSQTATSGSATPGDPTAPIRAWQFRMAGASGAQSIWIDNVSWTPDPTFTPPAATVIEGPPTARPADLPARDVTLTQKFTFDGGTTPNNSSSLALSGNTIYSLSQATGLQSWDLVSAPAAATQVPTQTEFEELFRFLWSSNSTGLLMADPNDLDSLYVVLVNQFNAPSGDRSVTRYDISANTWDEPIIRGLAPGSFYGDHSTVLVEREGQKQFWVAWMGASFYNSATLTGAGPTLSGVGNRWAGACTEIAAPGAAASEFYLLQQTNAAGAKISDNSQAYNAIYATGAVPLGCPGTLDRTVVRVSDSAQVLPWTTRATDGGAVNRHNMEYDPECNIVYVLRAGETNQLGAYHVDTDQWETINLLLPDASPLITDNADLLLVGSELYIMSRGQAAVYAFSVECAGDPCAGVTEGDSNGDGLVNFDDIDCFVAALISQAAWEGCGTSLTGDQYACANDIDDNASVNFDDIDPFIVCLITGTCP